MSQAAATADYVPPPYAIYRGLSGSASAEGQVVEDWLGKWRKSVSKSEFLGGKIRDALAELDAVVTEAITPNWDGEGAAAVNVQAYPKARDFIKSIPEAWPNPEISVDPDGAISMEWVLEPKRRLSVTFTSSLRISYAWIIGSERSYGVDVFGTEIPTGISDQIRRVIRV